MTTAQWPHPADTKLDRARRIACQLHAELAAREPRLAETLASSAAALGEGWLAPIEQLETAGETLTSAELGRRIGVSPATIRSWRRRGMISAYTVEEAQRVQKSINRAS